MSKRIPLTQGYYTIVNDSDYESVMEFRWCVSIHGEKQYAVTSINGEMVYLHRFLMGAKKGEIVDHINNDGLDNRIENIRIASDADNKMNRGIRRDNTLGYKGIKFDKRIQKWTARVFSEGKEIYIGSYNTPREAALNYDIAARCYYGDFAWLNFPTPDDLRPPLESMNDDMTQIRMNNGMYCKVDPQYWDYLSRYRWHPVKAWGGRWYAHRTMGKRGTGIYMHQEVMQLHIGRKLEKSEIIDHINGLETLDNRISNLRIADAAQSSANTGMRKSNKSGYRGVSWHKRAQKWMAMIGFRNKKTYLGVYEDKEEAHQVVESARDRIHGEWKRK